MKVNARNSTYRLLHETSGQVFIWAAIAMVCLLGMSGFVVDMGHAMVVNRQLQMSTNAAALAGAEDLPNTNYTTIASNYSSGAAGDKNYSNMGISGVSTSVSGYCSPTVESWGIHCVTVGSGSVNALTVTQTVTIPTYFISVLGIDSVTLTAQASAAWKGASTPYNVAIIVDTTQSMTDEDGDASNCGDSPRVACALSGAQTLLEHLSPCSASLATCPTVAAAWPSANISGAMDEVALYAFPGLNSTTTAEDDSDCAAQITSPGGTHSTTYYSWPGSTSYSSGSVPAPPTSNPATYYQVVGFSSDYKNSDSNTTSLLSGSYLVKAVGGGSTCSYDSKRGSTWQGIQDVGGAGTYYAAVVYQAQYDLYQQYVARLNAGTQTENVLIVLSDGDATSTPTQMGSSSTANSNSSGNFPSYIDECHQAITAALEATNGTYPSSSQETDDKAVPKTTVYTVAYGAESSGCDTANAAGNENEGLEPCDTMREMSSSYNWTPSTDQTFYSDYTASGGSSDCISNSNSSDNINQIFTEIAANLSHARLVPTGQ
ncbi:MAG TPA: pilus assembly protein TadG-related protein [Acidobacteriaceae bacterium]|nr:pilus assembly protein TadG-related protein [Acidobacteriaceae bacterium]